MIWNSTAVDKALAAIGPEQDGLLRDCKALLDSYHGVERSVEYYDLLAGEWLVHFAHTVYAAFVDDAEGQEEPPDSRILVFPDCNAYIRASTTSLLGVQLRQQVRRLLNGAGNAGQHFSGRTCAVGSRPQGISRQARARLRRTVRSMLGRKDASFMICKPYFTRGTYADWAAAVWKWRNWARHDNLEYPIEVAVEIDADWRRGASANSASGYKEIVRALLPLYIPVAYLEAFTPYRQECLALGLHRPRVIYTANSLLGHTQFKMLAADWREEGTRILDHQHGGSFGMDRIHVVEDYETRVADRFYTWGWQSRPGKQVPLAAPASAAFFAAPGGKDRVLLNCISFPNGLYRFHYYPMPGTIETMVAATAAFVRGVRGRVPLTMRPYIDDNGAAMTEVLRREDPGIALDDHSVPGVSSYARSSIVVHNYLGTSWLETLAMDIPTVCFYDPSTYAFREAAQPHIAALSAAGVLHTSGEDAARFVKSMVADPQGWWRAPEVQGARREFVRNYANFSPGWAADWEAEFRRWID